MSSDDYETWIDSEVANTINTFENTDVRATNLVVIENFKANGDSGGGIAFTIVGDHENRPTDFTNLVVINETDNADGKKIL